MLDTTAETPRGYAFSRQVLPAKTVRAATQIAQSRTIYLNRDGEILRPGDNNAAKHISSVVSSA